MAVAHRLAGLEEEAATAAQARDAVAERITELSAHVTETGAFVAALQQDVRKDAAEARVTVAERITSLSAHVTETGAFVAALQQDVRA